MNEAIILVGCIVLSFGIGALILDYFQNKSHQN